MTKKFLLLLSTLVLANCANGLKEGKLDPTYLELPVETKLYVLAPEKVSVKALSPKTNIPHTGGGLMGALIVSSINATANVSSVMKRKDKFEELNEALNQIDTNTPLQREIIPVLKKAPWIDVKSEHVAFFEHPEELKIEGTQVRAEMSEPTLTGVGNAFIFGEYFEYLQQEVLIRTVLIEEGTHKKTIYTIKGSGRYFLPDAKPQDVENYKLWLQNDSALLKHAVKDTTQKIRNSLPSKLRDFEDDDDL